MDLSQTLLNFLRSMDYKSTPRTPKKLALFNPDYVYRFSKASLLLPGQVMPRTLEPIQDFQFTVKGITNFPRGKINGDLENGVLLVDRDWDGNELSEPRSGYGHIATVAVRDFSTRRFGDLYQGEISLPESVLIRHVTTGIATVYFLTGDRHYAKEQRRLTSASRTPLPSQEHSLSV